MFRKRPSVLFSHVFGWSVRGRRGQQDPKRKSRVEGQVFESRRNVKLKSLARCMLFMVQKVWPLS